MVPISIGIWYDKTTLCRLGNKQVHPVVLVIMNLLMHVRRSEKGPALIGYCCKLPYSRQAMKKILRDEFNVKRDLDDVVRTVRNYLEQSYLRQLFEPVIALQKSGKVVKLQLGSGDNAETIHAVIDIFGVMGDNQGLHQCAGVYSAGSKCKMPCRECDIPGNSYMYSLFL